MSEFIEPKSGIKVSGDHEFVAHFAQICREQDELERKWVKFLQHYLVGAAHPDDGWVDRKRNRIHFQYPYFKSARLGLSDHVALGAPDKFRVVQICEMETSMLGLDYFHFHPEADYSLVDEWEMERAHGFVDWWYR